jgi:MFS superfamily sulfate permease-like transporter
MFREHILRAVSDAPNPVKWVVVAAEPITDVDITAADVLTELDAELHRAGIDILFAEMKGPVKDYLKRYGLFSKLGVDNFFPTIGQAVDDYLLRHHVIWQDWEDDSKNK